MADNNSIPHEAIIPIVFDGKRHFPGKQQLAGSCHIFQMVERKEPLVPLDEDPLQREWEEFIEDFPQCSRYLEPNFIDRNFPTLRKRLSGDARADTNDDEGDKVVIYDVDVKQFRPDDVHVRVKDGNISVAGRTEKVISGGGKYSKEELLGGLLIPTDIDANDVTLERTPELRLKISRPDSRPASTMLSASTWTHSSAENSLAER
ncbi:hypothetical protein MRX96_031278 [Rhipicephalus microplus]|uniref:SHSP domain-containing protein n=1 Tax=Rhipicephalus microplus TaxID=6941 RepID=A0A9J6EHH3_RHIMP|nr:uncharacterized protein LOC119160733 [Rhipicephalus microplus]KAH8033762.1 hypothetical protein HPB51_015794 [Rhipicephalus microplus]